MKLIAFLAVLGSSFAWKGKYSSSTSTSTSETYNPLMKQKDILREEIAGKVNSWRESRWDQLKVVLGREHFFRDFAGRMYSLQLDPATGRSQLWEIRNFKNVRSIGPGIGPYLAANSLTYDKATQQLYTLAFEDGFEARRVITINPWTGRGAFKCSINENHPLSGPAPIVLDIAKHPDGILVKWAGLTESSTYPLYTSLIQSDAGFNFTHNGDCICNVQDLENVGVSSLDDDEYPEFNTAIMVKPTSYDGPLIIDAAYTGGNGVAYRNQGEDPVYFKTMPDHAQFFLPHAGAYDSEFDAIWIMGTSSKWNFLCGYLLENFDCESPAAKCAPSACFEIPAMDGFAIASA